MLALSLATARPLFTRWTGYGWDIALLTVCLPVLHQRGLWNEFAVHWAWLPAYTIIAVMMFMLSVQLTAAHPGVYWHQVIASLRTAPSSIQLRWVIWAGHTAAYEELIWRIVVQSLLLIVLPPVLAVLAASLLFTVWHRGRIGNNALLAADLFVFSAITGGLLVVSDDPLAIFGAHAARNFLVYSGLYPHGRS